VKQAVLFASACAGIVLWHLPTTASCFARNVEGSYTCREGGAEPAPMNSPRAEVVRPFDAVVPTAVEPRRAAPRERDTAVDGAPSNVRSVDDAAFADESLPVPR
jgi:hypothetical protein